METSSVCDFLSAMMMAGMLVDWCASNDSQVEIISNVNRLADAVLTYRLMTQGIEIGADRRMMGETSGKEYASLVLAAPKWDPKKRYSNMGCNLLMMIKCLT